MIRGDGNQTDNNGCVPRGWSDGRCHEKAGLDVNKWFAVAAGGFTAFVCFWKLSRPSFVVDKPPEPEAKKPDRAAPKSPAPADSPTALIQKEATRSVQIIFMASLLQTLQERINTITFESEYTYKDSLENGVDVKSKAITDHIGEYLVENMDAADWQIVSATTGFVPRNIPNDGFAGFEYRAMKAKQIDRLNFMATQFKKLIDNYRKRPI